MLCFCISSWGVRALWAGIFLSDFWIPGPFHTWFPGTPTAHALCPLAMLCCDSGRRKDTSSPHLCWVSSLKVRATWERSSAPARAAIMGWRAQVGLLAPAGGVHFSPLTPPPKIHHRLWWWVAGVCNFLGCVTTKIWSDGRALQLSDGPVLQLRVTAQFYLEDKGKYTLEVWGHADPKNTKREREERGL